MLVVATGPSFIGFKPGMSNFDSFETRGLQLPEIIAGRGTQVLTPVFPPFDHRGCKNDQELNTGNPQRTTAIEPKIPMAK